MGNFLHRMEQDKSFDRIFLKEGAEESDISTCMQVYQIANNSPEWQFISREAQAKMVHY